jgi:O-antigen/teichoic acid export membrane protein
MSRRGRRSGGAHGGSNVGPNGAANAGEADAEDSGGSGLLRNSMFLMLSAALTAAIGFGFWGLVAHLYPASRIGLATSLLSAISLISYVSLFGFNSTLIRYPASGRARNGQISIALASVAATGLLVGAAYLAGLGLISPQLEFVRDSPWAAVSFVLFCALAAVNLLTDSVFIGARMPQYNTLVDGIIQSLVKLVMPVFLVALGAVGIITATGVGYLVAVVASIYFMYRKLGFRFEVRVKATRLRESARYSVSSYVSTLLNLLPLLVLPTIVLRKLGSEQSAYYFMAFQIATLLSAASYAIGQSLFSEGAHDPEHVGALLRRSARIMSLIVVPAAVALAVLSGPILSIFGAAYAQHAQGLLVVLSLGSVAVAFNSWAANALRIVSRMRSLVVSDVVLTGTVFGIAVGFGSRGLLWMGYAWVAGNLLSGVIAAARIPRHPAVEATKAAAAEAAADPVFHVETGPLPAAAMSAGFAELPTQPLFFPWNRPEAIRIGRPPRGPAGPQGDTGRIPVSPLSLDMSSMRQRPRATQTQPGRRGPLPVPPAGLNAEPRGVPQERRAAPSAEPPRGRHSRPANDRALRTDDPA